MHSSGRRAERRVTDTLRYCFQWANRKVSATHSSGCAMKEGTTVVRYVEKTLHPGDDTIVIRQRSAHIGLWRGWRRSKWQDGVQLCRVHSNNGTHILITIPTPTDCGVRTIRTIPQIPTIRTIRYERHERLDDQISHISDITHRAHVLTITWLACSCTCLVALDASTTSSLTPCCVFHSKQPAGNITAALCTCLIFLL